MDPTLERIIEKMKEQHILDKELIEFLHLPRGTFSNWKRNLGKSYYEHIVEIADKLNVSCDYLLRGRETNRQLSSNEEILLEKYRQLSPEMQNVINTGIKLI